MSGLTWKQFVAQSVRAYCDAQGCRTFSLTEFTDYCAKHLAAFGTKTKTPDASIRKSLQELRNDGLLTFLSHEGKPGHYTLRGVDLLKDEVAQPQAVLALFAAASSEQEREYVREVNARYKGWVKIARLTYGDFCLVPDCRNTFVKETGERYIEVHHIDPLCDGGEEQIWNLSVVCAHHHRMAHFANSATRRDLRDTLIARTQQFLQRPTGK